MRNIIIYVCMINAIAFFLYGLDKQKAKRHQWRIPESTLLGVADRRLHWSVFGNADISSQDEETKVLYWSADNLCSANGWNMGYFLLSEWF